jgi:hypothetical protein
MENVVKNSIIAECYVQENFKTNFNAYKGFPLLLCAHPHARLSEQVTDHHPD